MGICSGCMEYHDLVFDVLSPILNMAQLGTIWLTVLVSYERYMAVVHPLQSLHLRTKGKMRLSICIIIVSCIIFNIPIFFESHFQEYENDSSGQLTTVGKSKIYHYVYFAFLYMLFYFLVPLITLIFFNIRIAITLLKNRRQWNSLKLAQRKEHSMAMIPLCIVAIFLFCGTSNVVVRWLYTIIPHLLENMGFVIFNDVGLLMLAVNSASNFIVYCFLGKKFRTELKNICSCGSQRT